jgi:hypothetical protein
MRQHTISTTFRASAAILTLNTDGRLSFSLDGEPSWEAASLGVLHYYDRQHPRPDRLPVPSGNSREFGTLGTLSLSARSSISIEPRDDSSVMVRMEFDSIHIRIDMLVQVSADGGGFSVSVAPDGVCEEMPRLYRVLGLEVLPEFGAAKTGEVGYLTLPNWFGCQTFFDKDYPREVWQTIYSSNDEWENNCNAPVFGITRAHGTLCGLVTDGDEDARLVSRVHWEKRQANSVHPYLVWRWEQQDDMIAGAREVRYRFAPAECPQGEGYAFVGTVYRDFLRTERGVQVWADKAKTRPEAMDYIERFFLKIFMAYKEPHAKGAGAYHCTTTCDEAREIIRQCLDRGMTKLTVILVGWGQDGHDGKCPTYLPVDERVGGEAKMRELIAWCKDRDILLGVHTSHNGAYRCSDEFSEDDLVRHRSGEYWESVVWSGGQNHRICPEISLNKHVKRDLPALAELGFHGHHHYDAVGGFMCCYSPAHPVRQRAQYMELIRKECRVALRTMGSLSTEMPFGQYVGVMDGFFHCHSDPAPFLRACPIGQYFLDRPVPMLAVALHGSHHCCEAVGDRDRMLKLLDLGLAPQFEVCMRPSPEFGVRAYREQADMLAQAYDFSFGPNGYMPRIGKLDIAGRWEPAHGVTCTRYSNGTEVWVNRSAADFDGVPAGSVRWGKAHCPLSS